VGNLSRRVESLENGAPGPCPECGHDDDALVTYSIVWEGDADAPEESSPPCPRCGNVAVLVLDWEDDPSEPRMNYEKDAGAAAEVPDYPPWAEADAPRGGGVDGY
jgi:predicted RNA-binding Zn-ribbon protein involved in translation (DUF1610 family)